MPYTRKAFTVTIIGALLSLLLAVGGSVLVSLNVANITQQHICDGFEPFVKHPGPNANPRTLRVYHQEKEFLHRIGCP